MMENIKRSNAEISNEYRTKCVYCKSVPKLLMVTIALFVRNIVDNDEYQNVSV